MTREELEHARAYLRGETNPPPDFTGLARLGERLLAEVERLSGRHERIANKVRTFAHAEACEVDDAYDTYETDGCVCVLSVLDENVTPPAPAVDSAPCSDSSEVKT